MPWIVIEFPVADDASEAAAEALRAAGADGIAEEWRHGQSYARGFWKDAEEAPVRAAARTAIARLVEAGLLPTAPEFTVATMEDQDWLEGWKQYFSPLPISPRLAIAPSWEEYTPTPGQAVVILDPGMAFGTGTHGTTYTCLLALANTLQSGESVCDIGTGSGILAIAAAKLSAGRIVATDNDDLAIRVAQENADRNAVADAIDFRVADLAQGIDGPFDVVIANILAPVVLALLPALAPLLAPGARFISSGYILSQEDDIRAGLAGIGHDVCARYEREGWVTLVSSAR